MSKEAYYDTEIAPRLAEVARLCEAQGMSLVANVEFESGRTGRTEYGTGRESVAQLIAIWAARCNGNVDLLLMAIARHAREHGHRSVCLAQLGVPEAP